MVYFAPFIDDSGLNIPTYQDIEDFFVAKAKTIFGDDIYLEPDSQDFQEIATRSLAIYETLLTAQLAYNSRSPSTAIKTGLDSIVALNGIERIGGIFSIVSVVLTGSPGTIITNGVVADTNGQLWDLPASVTIESSGLATVVATSQVSGEITAVASSINQIMTPTFGWTAVTNPSSAIPGKSEESDSALRARQKLSVENPSQALVGGILGAILELSGVTSAQIYENDTGSPLATIDGATNPLNFPAHSITLVVTGGTDQEIADTISARKTPGAYTDGDVSITTFDQFSIPSTIRFYRTVDTSIDVVIDVTSLGGYNEDIGTALRQGVVDYINSLKAGKTIILSELWQSALATDPLAYPTFSLTALQANIDTLPIGTADIVLEFNQKPIASLGNIILNVT